MKFPGKGLSPASELAHRIIPPCWDALPQQLLMRALPLCTSPTSEVGGDSNVPRLLFYQRVTKKLDAPLRVTAVWA